MIWLHELFKVKTAIDALIRADWTKLGKKHHVPLVTWVNQDNIKALKQVE